MDTAVTGKTNEKLLDVRNLSVGIHENGRTDTVVERISFQLEQGEILGIVGESGCGKTVTVLSVLGLAAPAAKVTGGEALFEGRDLLRMPPAEKQKILGEEIGVIYQEPMSSLNPLQKIGKQVGEPLRLHLKLGDEEIRERVIRALSDVELPDPAKTADSYPHQLSGGMRQRVMLAMAGICAPKLLVCDEPTTALDVTTQAQILSLLRRWNKEKQMSILFISHDLAVINKVCDRIQVMYAGKIAETGSVRQILTEPAHPYTNGLIASIPTMRQKGKPLVCIPGRVPAVTEKKEACPFAPRCERKTEICLSEEPAKSVVPGKETHNVYCHHPYGKC